MFAAPTSWSLFPDVFDEQCFFRAWCAGYILFCAVFPRYISNNLPRLRLGNGGVRTPFACTPTITPSIFLPRFGSWRFPTSAVCAVSLCYIGATYVFRALYICFFWRIQSRWWFNRPGNKFFLLQFVGLFLLCRSIRFPTHPWYNAFLNSSQTAVATFLELPISASIGAAYSPLSACQEQP